MKWCWLQQEGRALPKQCEVLKYLPQSAFMPKKTTKTVCHVETGSAAALDFGLLTWWKKKLLRLILFSIAVVMTALEPAGEATPQQQQATATEYAFFADETTSERQQHTKINAQGRPGSIGGGGVLQMHPHQLRPTWWTPRLRYAKHNSTVYSLRRLVFFSSLPCNNKPPCINLPESGPTLGRELIVIITYRLLVCYCGCCCRSGVYMPVVFAHFPKKNKLK